MVDLQYFSKYREPFVLFVPYRLRVTDIRQDLCPGEHFDHNSEYVHGLTLHPSQSHWESHRTMVRVDRCITTSSLLSITE